MQPGSYRADIDGLRAISVLSVIAFHYGVTTISGGFVGVDVFFVISGYLITSLLLSQAVQGPISLVDFYARRARRILPALLVMIAGTLAVGWLLLLPNDFATASRSAAYAAIGFANIFFYKNTGYFDREAELQPLLHTWSLGVEEQFYLVWPIVVAIFLRRGARTNRLLPVVSVIVIASLVFAEIMVHRQPKFAFYSAFTRAWELGLGALLCVLPPMRSRVAGEVAGVLGLLLIGGSLFLLSQNAPFPGIRALPACLGAALVIWPKATSTFVERLLSTGPLVLIGLMSFSLYLWHWPVLVYWRIYHNGVHPDAWTSGMLAVLVAIVSFLSWRFVEKPLRRPRLMPWPTLVSAMCAMAVFVGAGFAISATGGLPQRFNPKIAAIGGLDVMWEWKCPQPIKVEGLPACAFGSDWKNAPRRILLWGDSHAEHWAPYLQALAPSDVSILLFRGCPPIVDGVEVERDYPGAKYMVGCIKVWNAVGRLIDTPRLETVILAAAWAAYGQQLRVPGQPIPDATGAAVLLRRGLDRIIEVHDRKGISTVVLADVPQRLGDPIPCVLAGRGLPRAPCAIQQIATPAAYFRSFHGPTNSVLRHVATETSAAVIFPGDAMCDEHTCIGELDGELLYRDTNHLRRNLPLQVTLALGRRIGLERVFSRP